MMSTPVRFFVLGAAFVAISGCAPLQSPSGSAASSADPALDTKAPLLPSALFSGQSKQFEGWHCSPARQHLITAVDGETLRLWSLHGAWRLPQAVVASGARYQDGEISFWNRGEQAIVETPRGQLKCELAASRAASTRQDHPGVMFRGQGNEPGWTVALAHDSPKLTLSTDYGDNVETLPYMVSVMDNEAGRVVLVNADAEDFFRVRIEAGACFDDMSGQPYPARVTLTLDGQQYSGCGQGIAPSA
ncbi:MliC family protein [Vreelandella arcis]|uniref:Membrane-bound lysozyme-inhibitor of c-type lysozyme n=1 Tax=Vreelandella arcis TaxID=416873 RepID=A0A1H0BRK8_9GAMM|nr:MliC family protein [Halomonas arcis]SDN48231.1 Membrane-bound lysozyme-inhibitor of c-type lysozyme [Halomonas arcis]